MRFFSRAKDGGPESTVTGYWLLELKKLFSIVLLRFDDGTRDAYHDHAFNSISWVLRGKLVEYTLHGRGVRAYRPSWRPIVTTRDTFHQVVSDKRSWVISFRGPWAKQWHEWNPSTGDYATLTDGREVIDEHRDQST
jgi:hypothetical protein